MTSSLNLTNEFIKHSKTAIANGQNCGDALIISDSNIYIDFGDGNSCHYLMEEKD